MLSARVDNPNSWIDKTASKTVDLFDVVLFLYFVTLHADQLQIKWGGVSLRVNNFLAIFLFLILLTRFRNQLFIMNRWLCLSQLIIGITICFSFCNSFYNTRCLLFLGWYGFTFLFYLFLPYVLVFLFNEQKIFKFYFASYLCVGGYACLQLLLSCIGIFDPFAHQYVIKGSMLRSNAFAYEPSFYALYMTPFVMMVNFHFLTDHKRRFFLFRSITASHVFLVNLLFLVSTSTAVFFAYCFFFFLTFLSFSTPYFSQLFGRFFRLIVSFALAGFAFGVLFPKLMIDFFMKFFFHGFLSHSSFYIRLIGIKNAWNVFLAHPFLGVGMGGYPPYMLDMWLKNDSRFTFFTSYVSIFHAHPSNIFKLFEPTNVFTEILASLGLLGMGSFLFLAALFWCQFKKSVRKDPSMVMNLFISTLVMVFVLQFNQGLFRTYIWTHFALAFAFMEKISHSNRLCEKSASHPFDAKMGNRLIYSTHSKI